MNVDENMHRSQSSSTVVKKCITPWRRSALTNFPCSQLLFYLISWKKYCAFHLKRTWFSSCWSFGQFCPILAQEQEMTASILFCFVIGISDQIIHIAKWIPPSWKYVWHKHSELMKGYKQGTGNKQTKWSEQKPGNFVSAELIGHSLTL